uniref:Probable NADPH dehydrogenase n=1 Tax=Pichia TaxID=4919 RepID=A0A5H1ZR30_9ASCO|nr:Chain A, Old Yellow Enzyme [Pichia]6AGZ_B Chain B, Old Yellow Enzyme [Pichia]
MTNDYNTPLADTNLFKPIKVGKIELKNRLVFPPTTRFRNTSDFVATDSMLSYYSQRAENNGGLLITEATFGAPQFGLYQNGPMIYTDRQVEAWKKIVEEVHKKGSHISMQLWNLGRAADPKLLKEHGLPFLAPSALYFSEESKKAAEEAGNEVQAMTLEQIEQTKKDYVNAAKNAIQKAGFDMVEVHSAHGYLLDQFIQTTANKRTDKYGGSIENRARLLLEVIDLVIEAVGADHVAVRLSPYATFQGSGGVDAEVHPIAQFGYILSELERRAKEGKRLAYVSIVEPRVNGIADAPENSEDNSWMLQIWKGVVLRSGGYLSEKGIAHLIKDVNADDRTLIGCSRYFTSNPDLPNRLRDGLPLTPYDRSRFYKIFSNDGYLTWGKYGEPEQPSDSAIALKTPQPLA